VQRPYIEDIIRWKIKLHLRQLTEEDDSWATCGDEHFWKGSESALVNYWTQIQQNDVLTLQFE